MKKENKSKNLLIISLFYFPDSRVGAKRFGNLVETFSSHYDNVCVLTIPGHQIPEKDPSLSPAGVVYSAPLIPVYPSDKKRNRFKRIAIRLWEKHLCLLDPYSGWILPGFLKAVNVINAKNIDVVIATGPPFSAMLVGALASLYTGKKLILDYRDPWTSYRKFSSPFGKIVNAISEKISIRLAKGIVFCSKTMESEFKEKYGRQRHLQLRVLTNGYKNDEGNTLPLYQDKNKVTMLYAGRLYGGRSLDMIAMALAELIRRKVIEARKFEFVIFGQIAPKEYQIIADYKLENYVHVMPAIPYKKVLRYMKGADILFLPSATEVRYAIPYKLFDYLMVKRPILAVAPENSAVEDIMRTIPAGYFCPTGDSERLIATLSELIRLSAGNYTLAKESTENYTWSKISQQYMRLIDSC